VSNKETKEYISPYLQNKLDEFEKLGGSIYNDGYAIIILEKFGFDVPRAAAAYVRAEKTSQAFQEEIMESHFGHYKKPLGHCLEFFADHDSPAAAIAYFKKISAETSQKGAELLLDLLYQEDLPVTQGGEA